MDALAQDAELNALKGSCSTHFIEKALRVNSEEK